jgi:hypothetical protein
MSKQAVYPIYENAQYQYTDENIKEYGYFKEERHVPT